MVGPEEVGRELQAHELVEHSVVILGMQGQPMRVKRVHTIATAYIAFQSTELGKNVITSWRQPSVRVAGVFSPSGS